VVLHDSKTLHTSHVSTRRPRKPFACLPFAAAAKHERNSWRQKAYDITSQSLFDVMAAKRCPICLRLRIAKNWRFLFFLTKAGKGPRWSRWVQASTPNSLGDSNPGPPSPRRKSQPLSLSIFARIGGALEPNDSLKESRDALVTHSSTLPHATRIVFRAFDRSPSELGDSLANAQTSPYCLQRQI
jgi:hypothetical protein